MIQFEERTHFFVLISFHSKLIFFVIWCCLNEIDAAVSNLVRPSSGSNHRRLLRSFQNSIVTSLHLLLCPCLCVFIFGMYVYVCCQTHFRLLPFVCATVCMKFVLRTLIRNAFHVEFRLSFGTCAFNLNLAYLIVLFSGTLYLTKSNF